MKLDISASGLSQIIEESYKEEFQNTRSQLAQLANEEFLNHYIRLDHNVDFSTQFKHLIKMPHCEHYQRFNPSIEKAEMIRKTIKEEFDKSLKENRKGLSMAQLKKMAEIKMKEHREKEELSSSRKQKREEYYEKLRVSRNLTFDEKEEKNNESQSPLKSGKKDNQTQQTIEDLFLRLEVIGEQRDKLKKEWYSWGENSPVTEQKTLVAKWRKNHQLMREMLEELLERLNKDIGTVEVFNQLRIADSSSVLSGSPLKKSRLQSEVNQSLAETRAQLSVEEKRVVYKFGSWYNRLLLDQRELDFIANI